MKAIVTLIAVSTLSLLPTSMAAQNHPDAASAPPQRFYRLHFEMAELDGTGKVTNTRSYEETIVTTGAGAPVGDQQIKTGSRVPIVTGSYGENSNPGNTQFQYIDLGVNLDV